MLEEITRTLSLKGINLLFEEGHEQKEIVRAIGKSLADFYASQFLDKLADPPDFPFDNGQGIDAPYFNYTISGPEYEVYPEPSRYVYSLLAWYSDGRIRKNTICFIDLFKNSETEYALRFRIANKSTMSKEDSAEHASRYFDFLEQSMDPNPESILHIIDFNAPYLNHPSTEQRQPLVRALRYALSSNIKPPLIVPTSESTTLIGFDVGCWCAQTLSGTPNENAQILFELIENPRISFLVENYLTGLPANDQRVIINPQNPRCTSALPILEDMLEGRRVDYSSSLK